MLPNILTTTPPAVGAVEHGRLFEAVAALLEQLAAARPLLVVLEDLHWADEMTVRLLAFVGRRVAHTRVLIAVTARAEETDESPALAAALDELAGDGRVTTLALAPLARADTDALVRALARSGSDAQGLARLADAVWVISEGNPFVVVESVQAADEGATLGEGLPLPERVRGIITRRIERLSERARTLATVAATVGRESEFVLLARAAGLADEDAAAALEELVRRRVLHGLGERFDFTHDRIRAVVYGGLLPPRRALWHRRVAEALEVVHAGALDTEAPAIAWHAVRGELPRDGDALLGGARRGPTAASRLHLTLFGGFQARLAPAAVEADVALFERAVADGTPESRRHLRRLKRARPTTPHGPISAATATRPPNAGRPSDSPERRV